MCTSIFADKLVSDVEAIEETGRRPEANRVTLKYKSGHQTLPTDVHS
jgi:hypothetical protein